MVTTWTSVFELPGYADAPEELRRSPNGFAGASLQRALRRGLQLSGWDFCEAFAEDFGWYADTRVRNGGRSVAVSLVTYPEGQTRPDGGAEDDRWRVVISVDLGLFGPTRAHRLGLFRRLAADVQAECQALGARQLVWETGGPIERAA